MRRIDLNTGFVRDPAAAALFREIMLASGEQNIVDIAAAFVVDGSYPETRELHVGTSTLEETQAFIATLIDDLRRGGSNRST